MRKATILIRKRETEYTDVTTVEDSRPQIIPHKYRIDFEVIINPGTLEEVELRGKTLVPYSSTMTDEYITQLIEKRLGI